MRVRRLSWFVAVVVAWGGLSGSGSGQASPSEKAVMRAIEQINLAFQNRDVKAYEALTSADFVRVGSNGRVTGRAEWMKTVVAAPGPARAAGKFDQVSVRLYGDGALVTYRNVPAGADGKPGPASYLTRVMAKQGTDWKLALAQSTDLTAPAPPTGPEPQPLPAWSASSAVEKEALAAFQAIQKANRDRDVAEWERLSASDHTIIGPDGARTTRADRVAALKGPAPAPAGSAPPVEQQSLRLIVKGDLAAATWTTETARSLKVLARKGGQWQQVLQQSSPIVAAKQ